MLDRQVPRFHVGILEILVHDEILRAQCGGGDDAVRWNDGLNQGGETSLKSRSLTAGKRGGAVGRHRSIERVSGAYREIAGVAVVRERCIADPEASANDGRFPQPIGQSE